MTHTQTLELKYVSDVILSLIPFSEHSSLFLYYDSPSELAVVTYKSMVIISFIYDLIIYSYLNDHKHKHKVTDKIFLGQRKL